MDDSRLPLTPKPPTFQVLPASLEMSAHEPAPQQAGTTSAPEASCTPWPQVGACGQGAGPVSGVGPAQDSPRVISDCYFRKTATEYDRKPVV